jgi:hypothetical protein
MRYFIEYNLGFKAPSNKKADLGTIVHGCLERMALCKKAEQDNLSYIENDILGKWNIVYDLDLLIEKVYNHYSSNITHHEWTKSDRDTIYKWVYKALETNNGQFDPRKRDIVAAEPHFDIIIDQPWAKYNYNVNGEITEGTLAIKGTIDLVTKINNNTYEVTDYKTGRFWSWATDKEKTVEDLQNDPQLMIYYYAISKLYNIPNIIMTIFYINSGGPITLCYDQSYLQKTEDMLRRRFEEVKRNTCPKRNRSWKCSKLCHFNKPLDKPLQEFRRREVTPYGSMMSACEQIYFDLNRIGIDKTILKYKRPDFEIGFYRDPGTV